MDVVQERLEREYELNLLATSPSVAYRAVLTDGTEAEIDNPANLPPIQRISELQEPWLELTIVAPADSIGAVMELVRGRRGEFSWMEYVQNQPNSNGDSAGPPTIGRVMLEYKVDSFVKTRFEEVPAI